MMHHASQGVRNALRRGSDVFVHHSGHNGPGGGTTANSTSRSLHLSSNLRGLWQIVQPELTPINSLEAIRPRNPPHRLFSVTKNVLQRLFTHLTTPGFRAPTYFAQTRSLRNISFRGNSIQSGLSFPARASLKNNALRRQANMFLPRAPNPPPPRCGGVTQVGLGAARNFTTGRPIFQQVAENIPIAGRALYEVDWDLEMRKEQDRARIMATKKSKATQKSKEFLKPAQRRDIPATMTHDVNDSSKPDLDYYFPWATTVTTFLYVPFAPRMPLPQHPAPDETLVPISELGAMHDSYATHELRVNTLFTRLEQADVWRRGVTYCCYSQGFRNRMQNLDEDESGICTCAKLVFEGWTKAEVRSIIGESGTGWCALEEVWHDQVSEPDSDALSEASLSLDNSLSRADSPTISDELEFIDPSESFIMPKLAFSSSFRRSVSESSSSTPEGFLDSTSNGLTADEYWLSSRTSSYSDLSDLAT